MYVVYVLRSQKDGRQYVGLTRDLSGRIRQHAQGRVRSTASRRPFLLEHVEHVPTRAEARKLEKYYKSAAGRRKLK